MKKSLYRELMFQAFSFETEDGYRVQCCHCKKELKFEEMTMEHIVPTALGGAAGHSSNMAPSCAPCNNQRLCEPANIHPDYVGQEKFGELIRRHKNRIHIERKRRWKEKCQAAHKPISILDFGTQP